MPGKSLWWWLILGVGLLLGYGVAPTPAARSREGVALWAIGEAMSRPGLRSLEEVLEPGGLPAGVEPQYFIVWGEPPADDRPFVRDEVVHGVWIGVEGRLYATDEETYRRYRPRCGDGRLTCVRFAILEFSEDEAVLQIDTFIAPLAGRGERITLQWAGDDWKVTHIEGIWIS
ncbi:MAG: hypothetical protein ACP5OO_09925 [Chloroflexia bacterium]